MAITSLINPTGDVSLQDSLWSIAWSTASGQIDMKYVFDVYVGNNQLIRAKVYPNPTNGRGYFDASRVIQNEVTYDWFTPYNVVNGAWIGHPPTASVMQTYNIRVGEEVSGITTLNMASGNVNAYNYIPRLYKRRQVTINSKLNNWLSDRPYTIYAQRGQKILIPYYGTDLGDGISLNINKRIGNTWSGEIEGATFFGTANDFIQLDIGTAAINTAFGSNTFIPTNCSEYIVKLFPETIGALTRPLNVKLLCDSTYTPINLHFMNAYGMFETANFRLVNKLQMDVERKSYQKDSARFTTNQVTYYNTQNVYHETKINFANNIKWKYKLTMDYPSDADFEWLEQLIYSPQVYAEIDDAYYPVTITNSNYEYYKQVYAGLKVLEIDIEMNQKRFAFKR